jgi:hypothetical protein
MKKIENSPLLILLKQKNDPDDLVIWSRKISNDNIELLAGMIAISIHILSKKPNNLSLILNNKNSSNNVKIDYSRCYFDTNVNINKYSKLTNIHNEDINFIKYQILNENLKKKDFMNYGVWLYSDMDYYYNLFRFKSVFFLTGVLQMCKMLNYDYKSCIYGLPFDQYGNLYKLNGYKLTSLLLVPTDFQDDFKNNIDEIKSITGFDDDEKLEDLDVDDSDHINENLLIFVGKED